MARLGVAGSPAPEMQTVLMTAVTPMPPRPAEPCEDIRRCDCGGRVVRKGAVVGCRACGEVFAMLLSMETRVPAAYEVDPPVS